MLQKITPWVCCTYRCTVDGLQHELKQTSFKQLSWWTHIVTVHNTTFLFTGNFTAVAAFISFWGRFLRTGFFLLVTLKQIKSFLLNSLKWELFKKTFWYSNTQSTTFHIYIKLCKHNISNAINLEHGQQLPFIKPNLN